MSKLFGGKKNKGPSQAELREQARKDYELAMKNQMSKEDAEAWRQEMQQDQLSSAGGILERLIDSGMSANENNPAFQNMGGQATERPSLMDLIGGQMQGGEQQQQQEPQPQQQPYPSNMGGQYADQIAAWQQQQAQQAQQQAQQAAMGQQGQMGQSSQMGGSAQMGGGTQMGGGALGPGHDLAMSDINNMLKSYNINNRF
jgi:hypothetical protein